MSMHKNIRESGTYSVLKDNTHSLSTLQAHQIQKLNMDEIQKEADKQEYTFKKVKLFKNDTLGTGSYGAVCKAKCDQLTCAAKLLYPVLFQVQPPDPGKKHRQPFCRFKQECEFLSRINHPNIVQYLGTYRDPETDAPVLLMELMDQSLTHFLESSPGDIPYHIQVNLSHDIAQALAFLHTNGIIHRDLSSNNVLLIAGSRAKVSDFGMSKFKDINKTRLATMTTCPGTPAFMSPEALNEPPVYTEKLDTFSLGILLVQIITRKFPNPADRFKAMQFPNPQNSSQMIQAMVAIPEVERRQVHISLIQPTHPLLPIAMECLKDKETERPSSQQICQSLDALHKADRYKQSLTQCKSQTYTQLQSQIFAKNQQLNAIRRDLHSKNTEITQLRALLDLAIQAREKGLESLDQDRKSQTGTTITLQQTLAKKDEERAMLRKTLPRKKRQASLPLGVQALRERIPQQKHPSKPPQVKSASMTHTSQPDSQMAIFAGSTAETSSKIYFKSRSSPGIYELNLANGNWGELPTHQLTEYTIIVISHTLTTIGGEIEKRIGSDTYSNLLYSFNNIKWAKHFPPMSKKRTLPAAVCNSNVLVVAGGMKAKEVDTVEVMDITVKYWSIVSSLPFSTFQPSAQIHGKDIYIHPRYLLTEQDKHLYSVVKCSLAELVASKPTSAKWKNISSLPVSHSTLATVNGRLLAVGGETVTGNCTQEIHEYNPDTDTWQVVSMMLEARSYCLTAVLPDNKLMIAGGDLSNRKIETIKLA